MSIIVHARVQKLIKLVNLSAANSISIGLNWFRPVIKLLNDDRRLLSRISYYSARPRNDSFLLNDNNESQQ